MPERSLAERAVACPGFRWMPGMVDVEGSRVIKVEGASVMVWWDDANEVWWMPAADMKPPDLEDVATLECTRAMLSAAWGGNVDVFDLEFADKWSCLEVVGHGFPVQRFRTNMGGRAERIVSVLEAAPPREAQSG